MVFLMLEGCEKCTDLPPLGQLPLLKDLRITRMNGVVTVGPEFYGEGCFPSLETLCFVDMHEWMNWSPNVVEKHDNLFARLREFSIMRCPKLRGSLPDHLPSLEKLEFRECKRLIASISSFPKLYRVEIGDCQNVRDSAFDLSSLNSMILGRFPTETFLTEGLINGSKRVEYLKILYCDEMLSLWPNEESLLQHLALLRHLVIKRCQNLENLNGLHNLSSLTDMRIEKCPLLVSFPERILPATLKQLEIVDCNALESISEAISWHKYNNNSSLEYLHIVSCDSLTSIARSSLVSTVQKLEINCCRSLESLVNDDDDDDYNDDDDASSSCSSPSISSKSLLESLSISECPSLTFLFSSSRKELPSTLKTLLIRKCPKLGSIGESLPNNSSLELIRIQNCESLVRFPDGGSPAANLRKLEIYNCEKLEAMPNRMQDFKSLHEFSIWGCPAIVSFPEQGLPTNITLLTIGIPNICKPLLEWGLHRLDSLRALFIDSGCPNMVTFPAKVLPSSLVHISIKDFPNLERLSSRGFQNLTSLEVLTIKNCPKIQYLPEEGLFPSLLELEIVDCPLLKQRCIRDEGQEWPKISHVPQVHIDYEPI